MRMIEWSKTLEQQRRDYGKTVFSVTELANISGLSPRSLNMALQRLIKYGVLQRYSTGRYGLPGGSRAEDIVPSLDSLAYITGLYVLYDQQVITQKQRQITCFTRRRHNRGRVRETACGKIVFMCVATAVYAPPLDSVTASLEQAFCDALYICRKRGVRISELVTFRNLDRVDKVMVNEMLYKYPVSVRHEAGVILSINQHPAGTRRAV